MSKRRTLATKSVELVGVDLKDYPDFCDAYVSYAEWDDGTPLNEEELDALHDTHGDLINQLAHEAIYD